VGVRSINALLAVGGGQRIGLFAGSGVGKSVLLGMMTRYTKADVTVVGLIGERGAKCRIFVSNTLGPDGMRRAVVVATPADNTPLMRLHGAWLATAIAEYFRDRGLRVLLLLDSLTRFAQAQREIALAIGEPPATKGYPPSVFARLPQLVERARVGDRIVLHARERDRTIRSPDRVPRSTSCGSRAKTEGGYPCCRRLADRQRDFALRLRESRQGVEQQQHPQAAVAEVFRDRGREPRAVQPHQRRVVGGRGDHHGAPHAVRPQGIADEILHFAPALADQPDDGHVAFV